MGTSGEVAKVLFCGNGNRTKELMRKIIENKDEIEVVVKPMYQHQERPNEEFFDCQNEYLDGTWCN